MRHLEQYAKSPFEWPLILLFLMLASTITIVLLDRSMPQKTIDIAIYSDAGTWGESVQATQKMFQWMGYTVEMVKAKDINEPNFLNRFRILCVPGGDMYQYSQDISPNGREKIRDFVRSGHGYIGICGGAYYANEEVIWRGSKLPMTPLGLLQGTAIGPLNEIVEYPNYAMVDIRMADSGHPITREESSPAWILYYWGPTFVIDDEHNISILGRYARTNQPAIVALAYGRGRVFLIGTHPEIEEDSDRDGVTFGDELEDKGSDWELMKKAVVWCLEAEPSS